MDANSFEPFVMFWSMYLLMPFYVHAQFQPTPCWKIVGRQNEWVDQMILAWFSKMMSLSPCVRDLIGKDVKFVCHISNICHITYCCRSWLLCQCAYHTHSLFFKTSWCTLICCRFFYARYNRLQPINTLLFRGWCIIII